MVNRVPEDIAWRLRLLRAKVQYRMLSINAGDTPFVAGMEDIFNLADSFDFKKLNEKDFLDYVKMLEEATFVGVFDLSSSQFLRAQEKIFETIDTYYQGAAPPNTVELKKAGLLVVGVSREMGGLGLDKLIHGYTGPEALADSEELKALYQVAVEAEEYNLALLRKYPEDRDEILSNLCIIGHPLASCMLLRGDSKAGEKMDLLIAHAEESLLLNPEQSLRVATAINAYSLKMIYLTQRGAVDQLPAAMARFMELKKEVEALGANANRGEEAKEKEDAESDDLESLLDDVLD
ncbi:MAG: hypothetical protein AAF492_14415 [Verrucomicrobiota bacterium]